MGEAMPALSPEVLLVEDGDIDGVELARRIRALRASISVVYSSGRRGEVEHAVAGSAFLPKPFILAQACAAVERMVARRQAA